jgi:HEAT repeat protein
MGGGGVIDRIEEVLRAMLGDPSDAVREAAAAALDRVRARRAAAPLQAGVAGGSLSLEERIRAVFVAEEVGGPEGLSLLLTALEDPDAEVRAAAARALEGFLTPPVLKAMVGRLSRETGVVLGNLIEALGKSRRKELSPILERYMDHPDEEVRGRAIVAYARVAGPAGWEKILSLAENMSETVRVAVARSLAEASGS